MAQGKQAKTLTSEQEAAVLAYVKRHRHATRNRVAFLLSFKAGLRSKEISKLTWGMVLDAKDGLADTIELPNSASKGRDGGRSIPMHPDLRTALLALMREVKQVFGELDRDWPVIISQRGPGLHFSEAAMINFFARIYDKCGLDASSHSGRRTFATKAARTVEAAGGSVRDVQQLLGHASIATTQLYIEGNSSAKRKVVSGM